SQGRRPHRACGADQLGEDLHLGKGEPHRLQRLLVDAGDDPVEPGNAHAEAGATDLLGEVIGDRVLSYSRPSNVTRLLSCSYIILQECAPCSSVPTTHHQSGGPRAWPAS